MVRLVFVAISEIKIDSALSDTLENMFKNRSHKVDSVDGFLGLHFIKNEKKDKFVGIFRFKDKSSFLKYMKSDLHVHTHQENYSVIQDAIKSNSIEFFTEITQ